MDTRRHGRHSGRVPRNHGRPGIATLLATAAASVAAVPVVLGFITLGAVVLAGRVLVDAAGQALGVRARRRGARKLRAR